MTESYITFFEDFTYDQNLSNPCYFLNSNSITLNILLYCTVNLFCCMNIKVMSPY